MGPFLKTREEDEDEDEGDLSDETGEEDTRDIAVDAGVPKTIGGQIRQC
jgi:hypothetical protein